MNPYDHSDLAVFIYQFFLKSSLDHELPQNDLGSLACELAVKISKAFDVELQPAPSQE